MTDDETFLIDTNILVYYLDGDTPADNTRIDTIFRDSFDVSIISKIEPPDRHAQNNVKWTGKSWKMSI